MRVSSNRRFNVKRDGNDAAGKNGVTIHITYDRIKDDEPLKDAVIRVIQLLGRYWTKTPRRKKKRIQVRAGDG